jgi:hypothetical protein
LASSAGETAFKSNLGFGGGPPLHSAATAALELTANTAAATIEVDNLIFSSFFLQALVVLLRPMCAPL